jgi:tetratricopeptide (TPR) repeat protein
MNTNTKHIFGNNKSASIKNKKPIPIDTQFQLATSFHQQGRVDEAILLYKAILSEKSNHADALHLLGLAHAQIGKLSEAQEYISKAINFIPEQKIFHNNLGNIYTELLQYENAIDSYNKAIEIDSSYSEPFKNKGMVFFKQSKYKQAIEIFERWADINPNNPEAYFNIGTSYLNSAELEKAKKYFEKAISLVENFTDAYINLGIIEYKLKNYSQAEKLFLKASNLDKSAYDPYNYRGLIYMELNQPDSMRHEFHNLIKISSSSPYAHIDYGYCLMEYAKRRQDNKNSNNTENSRIKSLEEALSHLEIAKKINPTIPEIYYNIGCIYQSLGQCELAIDSYKKAIALNNKYYQAYNNLAGTYDMLNLCEESIKNYSLAKELNQTNQLIENYNLAFPLLKIGDYGNGWRNYEDRWNARSHIQSRHFKQPQWSRDEALIGKTILLHAEQGLGDTLQFIRYVPLVVSLGANVIVEVQEPLLHLFRNIQGVQQIIKYGDPLPVFDVHCPLMSLPFVFNTTLNTIPSAIELHIDEEKKNYWKNKFINIKKLKIGLVWNGGFRKDQPEIWDVNARRNLPLAQLKVLSGVDAEFISLQKGEPAESEFKQALITGWDGPVIHNVVDELKDFLDTAALVLNLDLVIAVDTSTAHLAATLGKPVWLLNRYDTCWRWLLDTEDSPWYPSVKIYRQPSIGYWDTVMQKIRFDLSKLSSANIT